ncbi:2TM domain-containing protein [Sinomicrobium sp. M5D2P9]
MEIYTKEEKYLRAKKRLDREKAFYRHLLWYSVINLFLIGFIGVETYKDGEEFWTFGTFSTAIFWGIGVVIHGMSVFIPNLFLSKEWEKRQIRRYMEKEERKRQRWE